MRVLEIEMTIRIHVPLLVGTPLGDLRAHPQGLRSMRTHSLPAEAERIVACSAALKQPVGRNLAHKATAESQL